MKKQVFPSDLSHADLYQFVIGSIGPRPIAFVSTLSSDGVKNLAPYSFFNVFSVNPFIVAFSTSIKPKNNTKKDTFQNILDTGECVINVVSADIMDQMSITASDFDKSVDEFEKGGFTAIPSVIVKPFTVKESKANLECKVNQIIELGSPATGYLVICNVERMQINEDIIDGNRIDPNKIDLVGRMGRNFYSRTNGVSNVIVERAFNHLPLGFDALPDEIRNNPYLSGKELSYFANLETLKTDEDLQLDDTILDLSEKEFIDDIIRPMIFQRTSEAYTMLCSYYKIQV
jgi:flavin reductase (DIM6/NTAB) family NADH-FMN oxidoreductase RutF